MSPSIRTMGFFMFEINFCNTKEQLNHLGEVVTGKVDGSPSGADIDTSTLTYTGQVRKTLPALESEYETSIATKQAEADAAIDEYRLLFKGAYAAGITLESRFEYINYNGASYFATNPPYTTTATTPDADGNLFAGGYTTIETVANKIGNPNLLSNSNFLTPSPEMITPPNATPESYVAGTQIFSGVYAGSSGVTVTLINGRVNCSAGSYEYRVANKNGLDRVPVFTSSVSDYDGNPVATGVSHALVSDEYIVTVTPAAGDVFSVKFEQGDIATKHVVQSSNVIVSAEDYGIFADGTDYTSRIRSLLSSNNISVAFSSGEYVFSTGDLTADNIRLYFFGSSSVKNPDGMTDSVIGFSGKNCSVYDAIVDGNGQSTGQLGSDSYVGIFLQGEGNKSIRCTAHSVGYYSTSGDLGGASQTGVGIGSNGTNNDNRNVIEHPITYNCRNYGLNVKFNTNVIGGNTYLNGTNGLGARYAENSKFIGLTVGVQKQDNPDTLSVGVTIDRELSGGDADKLSRNIEFISCDIAAQESFSLSCTQATDISWLGGVISGDVLIQSNIPDGVNVVGNKGSVLLDAKVDGRLQVMNISRFAVGEQWQQSSSSAADVLISGVNKLELQHGAVTCSDNHIVRLQNCLDVTLGFTLYEGRLDLDNCKTSGWVKCIAESATTDQNALIIRNTSRGQLKAIVTRYGFPVDASSVNLDFDLSDSEFTDCGAPDGLNQNADINCKNSTGVTASNTNHIRTNGRLIYADNASEFVANGGCVRGGTNILSASGGDYSFQGWSVFASTTVNMFVDDKQVSKVKGNVFGTSVNILNYPAGDTRPNSASTGLEMWDGTGWITL